MVLRRKNKISRPPLRARAGFTLVEVIVALLILLVTSGGILASFVVAKRYATRSKRRIIAINYARQALENLYPYPRVDALNTWNAPGNPLYAPNGGNQPYPAIVLPDEFGSVWSGVSRYTVFNTTSTTWRRVNVVVDWTEPPTP